MRLRLTLLFAFAFMVGPAKAAPQKSDRERDGLKGSVHRIELKHTFFHKKNGKHEESKPPDDHGFVEYDKVGNKLNDTSTSPCDACGIVKNHYDAKGRVVRAEHSRLLEPDKVWLTIVYSYNQAGLLDQEDHYDESNILYRKWRHKYEYDERGNWIKETAYMQDEKFFDGDTAFVPREAIYRAISCKHKAFHRVPPGVFIDFGSGQMLESN